MRNIVLVILLFLSGERLYAQEPDAGTLHETAKQFMRTADWTNAILVLNKALAQEPNNLAIKKDLALTQYYQRDFASAKENINQLMQREDADAQVYQIAGNIYKALDELKECGKIYRKALASFSESGALYAEYGELLWLQQDPECMDQWLLGIEKDPSYSGNYYYAAKAKYTQGALVWALLYGEIFINLESYSKRTAEIKTLLFEAYKKYFSGAVNSDSKQSAFIQEVSTHLKKNQSVVVSGITTESLIMLRTKFLLDWQHASAGKFPYRLFEHQQQLLKEGMFEAYNYWIFEAAANLNNYDKWIKENANAYRDFTRFQRSKVFKVPGGQHYRK
jgi:tetratricopeptide (TPR) repeat protein